MICCRSYTLFALYSHLSVAFYKMLTWSSRISIAPSLALKHYILCSLVYSLFMLLVYEISMSVQRDKYGTDEYTIEPES